LQIAVPPQHADRDAADDGVRVECAMSADLTPNQRGDTFANPNVVPLGGAFGKRRMMKPEMVAVINDCRDIALKRMTEALAKTLDTIEDELFSLAEKSIDREQQNLFLDARAQAREKRSAMESQFRKQFLGFFERKVAGADEAEKTKAVDFSSLEMSLVEDDALEEKLAIDDITKRLGNKCDDELRAVSQRMGFMLSEPELKDDANPVAPDTIVKALQAACDQMAANFQTKLTVMRMIEQGFAKEMHGVYRDINTHLVSREILPQIRVAYRRPQASGARKAADTADSNAASGESAAKSTAATAPNDLFATLQQLMAGSASGAAFAATTHDGTVAAEHAGAVTSAGLLNALSRFQEQFEAGQFQGAQFAAMDRVHNFVPGETPVATLNVVRELKEQGVANTGNQVDAMTIDIIAMLFDYVFEDTAIPDAVKALLAKLQIPVLKVAIMDKAFFSKKAHPARRLLDVLAEASLCFAGHANKEDPLFQKIESIVDRLHHEFETDVALFEQVLADFEAFMLVHESASADMVERSARALHDGEKREMARMIALDETERRASANDLPEAVTSMLRGPWARALERIYLREGGRNQHFADALEVAEDLVWSVAPKLDADARKSLVGMLPSLLKRLQDGLDIAAVEQQDRDLFFAALVDCHAAAVKAGLRGESVSALLSANQNSAASAPLFQRLIDEERVRDDAARSATRSGVSRIQFTEDGVEIEEIAGAAPTPDTDSGATEADGNNGAFNFTSEIDMPTLKRGMWVEFLQASGEKVRAKLSWVSPLKGVYLFTNPGATEAMSIAPDALLQQFRRGVAKLMEESSLIDRAVDRMVSSLSNANAPA
jgi:hypothetical protein